MLRLALPVLAFLAWTPAAHAWSWPVHGPVVRPFAYDEAHPYASGQHRGIDVGAEAAGETVVAPAAGTVSFAGTVPTNGETVTIETPDGYSVTLTHLGAILVAKGATVAERDAVGTIGPSGTPEVDGPYVHLGIRVASDPDGYVDPLSLLPPPTESGAAQADPVASQSSASSGSSATTTTTQPAPAPAASTPAAITITRGSTVAPRAARNSHHAGDRAQRPRARVHAQRPAAHPAGAGLRVSHRVPTSHRRVSRPTRSSQRPVVEAAAPSPSTGLDAGHEPQPSVSVSPAERARPRTFAGLIPLLCNGAAALVALAAALRVARRRRRHPPAELEGAQVLHLPQRAVERRAA